MERKEKLRRWRNLLLAAVAAAVVLVAFCIKVYNDGGIQCLFYRFTGWLCPGCGNTRAAMALLRLDVKAALAYNMLFPLEIFYICWVLFHCCRAYLRGQEFAYRPPWEGLDIGILTVLVLWGLLRNIL